MRHALCGATKWLTKDETEGEAKWKAKKIEDVAKRGGVETRGR